MSRYLTSFAAAVAFAASVVPLSADTIKLEGGGTIRGQILDDKSTKDVLVVKAEPSGGEVRIERKKILEITREKSGVAEYEAIKDDYAETADDQFRLALWCEEHKLSKQRREHLLKVIELDPNHAQARAKLGYVRNDGKWLTANEVKEAKGLVRFQGRYVTPQEKELLEQKKAQDDVVREWHQKIRLWKGWVTGNDPVKGRQGDEKLRAIDDPQALEAVVGQLGKEKQESLRILMCDILVNLPGEQATLELVKRSLIDVSEKVRWAAIDKLVEREDSSATRILIKALASDQAIVLRRAANALGAIGDPVAVPALITALVTKQPQVVNRGFQGASLGGTSTPVVVDHEVTVTNGVIVTRPIIAMQGSGLGIGGVKQEIVLVDTENPDVLESLRTITKADYGYDQILWRQWYAAQMRKEELKARRQLDKP